MNKSIMHRFILFLFLFALLLPCLSGCEKNKETVLIYTSSEDFKIEYMTEVLSERFPEYDIVIEYISTGNHAAKLLSEGKDTDCDITHNLEYTYLSQLDEKGYLADLSGYDKSIYCDDTVESQNYIVEIRSSGAVILNLDVLARKNLPEPTSYQDLLDPMYKNLISMPNPKSSSTGYIFLKSLVNAWGEEKALQYFDALSENVLQFTTSGSGPVNALIQEEVAIGLGMLAQGVREINNGSNLKLVFFEEGAPFTLAGQAIIKGKETRPAVKEVFDFLINEYNYMNNEKFFPEKIYKDKDYTVENYPAYIPYANMQDNTDAAKRALLDKWVH